MEPDDAEVVEQLAVCAGNLRGSVGTAVGTEAGGAGGEGYRCGQWVYYYGCAAGHIGGATAYRIYRLYGIGACCRNQPVIKGAAIAGKSANKGGTIIKIIVHAYLCGAGQVDVLSRIAGAIMAQAGYAHIIGKWYCIYIYREGHIATGGNQFVRDGW